MEIIGLQSLITLLTRLFFIAISFWALQSLRIDHLFRKGHSQQVRVFYILLAIVIGYLVSSFFLDFLTHSQNMILFIQ